MSVRTRDRKPGTVRSYIPKVDILEEKASCSGFEPLSELASSHKKAALHPAGTLLELMKLESIKKEGNCFESAF
jgi:hypothetical protein